MIGTFENMTDLFDRASERLLFGTREQLHSWSGMTAIIFNNLLMAKSMEFDFDAARDLWFTNRRFPKLQRDYLDPKQIDPFIDRSVSIARKHGRRGVVTEMLCKSAIKETTGEHMHEWGNCMMGFTFKGGFGNQQGWTQPTLTMHSRVSYISYIGGLDMALAWVLAREIAEQSGCFAVEEMAFVWQATALQWHGFKCIPYMVAKGWEDEVMTRGKEATSAQTHPAIRMTYNAHKDILWHYQHGTDPTIEQFPYGPLRRMHERYKLVMDAERGLGKPLPPLPVQEMRLLDREMWHGKDRRRKEQALVESV